MNKYEQEVFNFLTLRDNFEPMLQVISHFSHVREQLLENFWNAVYTSVAEQTTLLSNDWRVINPERKSRSDAKLIIYKDSWKLDESYPFVGIAWERLYTNNYYGVWSHKESPNIENAKLNAALERYRNANGFRSDPHWWFLWKHGRYNFEINESIGAILPDQADSLVKEYSENLISVLPDCEKIIDIVLNRSGADISSD